VECWDVASVETKTAHEKPYLLAATVWIETVIRDACNVQP
jgi:hypothetical protein